MSNLMHSLSGKISMEPGLSNSYNRLAVQIWLFILLLLIFFMILVGGLTRLTDSGLSITDWAPIMGAFPPISLRDWMHLFNDYQKTSEFVLQNNTMTLEEFKYIFWWEWGHRQFGRLIGLVWFLGFIFLNYITSLPRFLFMSGLFLGVLGLAQAFIGWWMVKSGLNSEETMLDVASYRLAIHLSLALIIFSMVYFLIRINGAWPDEPAPKKSVDRISVEEILTNLFLGGFFVQVFLGALVSGIDAGQSYTDWPLMNGKIVPEDIFYLVPGYTNFLENPALVQFNHRLMGYLLFILGSIIWMRGIRKVNLYGDQKINYHLLFGLLSLQVIIGIFALLNSVPLYLGLAHQLVAILLLLSILNLKFNLYNERRGKVPSK